MIQFNDDNFTKEEVVMVDGKIMVASTTVIPPKIAQARVIYELEESSLCGHIVDKYFFDNFNTILPKLKKKFTNNDDLLNFVIPTLKGAGYTGKGYSIHKFMWECFIRDNEIFKRHHWYNWKANFHCQVAFESESASKLIVAVREFPSYFCEEVPKLGVLLKSKYKDEVLDLLNANKKINKVITTQSIKVGYDLFKEIVEKYGMVPFSTLKSVFVHDRVGMYIKKEDEEPIKDYISEVLDVTKFKRYDVRDVIKMFPKVLLYNDISKFNITSKHFEKWVGPDHLYAGTKEEYETKLMYLKLRD